MPEYSPYEMDGEGPGSVRYRTISGERRPTAVPTASTKMVLGYDGTAPPILKPVALDAGYLPNRTRTIAIVPAGEIGADKEWIVLAGTPDFAQRNALYGAIAYDAAAIESVQWLRSMIVTQDYVSTIQATLVWTNLGAGSGNVVWRIGYSTGSDGVAFAALTTGDSTVTAPAQNVLKYTTANITPTVAAGTMLNFSVGRVGTDVADTLANDAGFVALVITILADM